jgi:hypothetical protein
VHRCERILCADEKIWLAGLLPKHVRGSAGMKLNGSGQQIGIRWNYVAIFPNAGNFTAYLHLSE